MQLAWHHFPVRRVLCLEVFFEIVGVRFELAIFGYRFKQLLVFFVEHLSQVFNLLFVRIDVVVSDLVDSEVLVISFRLFSVLIRKVLILSLHHFFVVPEDFKLFLGLFVGSH